jgi:hypothetical protein
MSHQSAASADSTKASFFRIRSVVQELGGRLDEDHDFRFNFNKPRPAVVCFARDRSQIEDLTRTTTVCTATCDAEIPIAVAEKLAAPLKDEVAAIGSLSRLELAAIDKIYEDLSSLLKSTIDMFRWRHGLIGGPVGGREAFYSEGGKRWLKASLVRGIELKIGFPFKSSLKDVPSGEIVRLVEEGKGEPVAHQLFREAWALRDSNPASALVIGMAAAELGVKDLIAALVPNAQWLAKEIPSPPLMKILREYIPNLPVRARFKDKALKPPKELITLINRGTEFRNNLVHRGGAPPNRRVLREILRAVRDVLWICELYAGEPWAGSHVSANTTIQWRESGG